MKVRAVPLVAAAMAFLALSLSAQKSLPYSYLEKLTTIDHLQKLTFTELANLTLHAERGVPDAQYKLALALRRSNRPQRQGDSAALVAESRRTGISACRDGLGFNGSFLNIPQANSRITGMLAGGYARRQCKAMPKRNSGWGSPMIEATLEA